MARARCLTATPGDLPSQPANAFNRCQHGAAIVLFRRRTRIKF
jgi:hypothetical protein